MRSAPATADAAAGPAVLRAGAGAPGPVSAHGVRRRRLAAWLLMTASGFAGLGCQIVWTRQFGLVLGNEAAAVLAVLAAFFGGLALGAWSLGARIGRSRHPVAWYAACEAAIGLWGFVLAEWIVPHRGDVLATATGAFAAPAEAWAVDFVVTALLLLPATAAMGATLPAMARIVARLRERGSAVPGLYASNTVGAVIGVLAAAFWLIPGLGLVRTAELCAGLNLFCAAAALGAFGHGSAGAPAMPVRGERRLHAARGLARLAATGLLGIGYEVVAVRVLGQVAEDTVYTYALLLAVYLVGSALGAAALGRWTRHRAPDPHRTDRLLCALAAACLVGAGGLWAAEALQARLLGWLGAGMPAALCAEATIAIAAFGLPTVAMGALFCHLAAAADAAGIGLGRALGANTCGAAAAPPLFGMLIVPALGPKAALLGIVAGYLALTSHRSRTARRAAWPAAAVAASALAIAAMAPPLAFVDVPDGGHVVRYIEGPTAAVSVVEDAAGVARLRIDNRQQEGSSATRAVDARQALLPLLLHPAPRRALFLGLGTGVTAAEAAEDPQLQVDAVELLPEVIAASADFTAAFDAGPGGARLHRIVADARRYVRATAQHYDVIVADNFHPARAGSGALYTVEHFRAVRARLADGGVFCQWLPLHQLDRETLRSIVQSFIAVNPGATAILASNSLETPVLGLLGRTDDGRFDADAVRSRLWASRPAGAAAELGLHDAFALLGSFVAGPAALRRFAGEAPANTDDRPVVAYLAPTATYAPTELPRDRLLSLLREFSIGPGEVDDANSDPAALRRLAAYREARDRYLAAGRDVRPSPDVSRMLAQVREPLLAVLRISPDFRPAHDPLLAMARALQMSDAAAARSLFAELARIDAQRSDPVRGTIPGRQDVDKSVD